MVHMYAEAGSYDAEVCASDEDGGETCQQFTVTVKDGGQLSSTVVVVATTGAVVVVVAASSKGYLTALLASMKRRFF